MAMIKCSECGADISDKAIACPHCGFQAARKKYCKHCGAEIDFDCVVCPRCGKQVETIKTDSSATQQPQPVIINNNNNNSSSSSSAASAAAAAAVMGGRGGYYGRLCNKWTAFFLCLFLGFLGAHKFYEGKKGMGILYIFTGGLVGIGVLIDLISILLKPNPYYV